MDFLLLTTLVAVFGTVLMLFIYIYLYCIYREPYMGAWIISWILHLTRLTLFESGLFSWKQSVLSCITYQMFFISCATMLIYSAHLFIKKPLNKYWLYAAAIASILSVIFDLMNVSALWRLVLPACLGAIMLFYIGRIFNCKLQIKGAGRYITGYAFILWGVFTAVIPPFFATDTVLPQWITLLCGITRFVIAAGILLVYFEKTRADLINNEESLRQTNRELNSFCHSVAHDLKAPLLSINKLAEYLGLDYADKLDRDGQELIQNIREKSVEVIKITDHLLELSKMGEMPMKIEVIRLEPLFREVYEELIELQPERQVSFHIKQLPDIHGDPVMIKLLVRNILSNALKYTRTRERAVIEVDTKEDETNYIISVQDNGVGFDMRYASRLFGVFERLHSNNEFEGSGIGLAISQKILQRHQGKAWLVGKVDEGAVFSFSFPKDSQKQHSWPILILPNSVL